MKIGFDLDKIFINNPLNISDTVMQRLSKRNSPKELHYRIPSRTEQLLRRMTHLGTIRKPIKENLQFLQKLTQEHKNKYYLITGRFQYLKEKTDEFISQYHFDTMFDGMYFNYHNKQPHLFKNVIISKLHLDKYVDDDLDLLQYVTVRNPGTQFFWLNNSIRGRMQKNLSAITKLDQMFSESDSSLRMRT